MNSRPLSLNGRLLMPILVLLLMNVPVTEAKFDWSEGTKGAFATVGWAILTVATISGMIATMVYGYKTRFGHRTVPSEEETSKRLRESTAWLSYIAWIRVDLWTTRDLERAAAARVIDVESQLFEVPRPHPLLYRIFNYLVPSKLFSCFFRAAENGSASPTSGDASTNRRSRRNKGKASEQHHTSHSHISTADGTSSDHKNATQKSTSSAKSPSPRRKSRTESTTSKDGEIVIHGSTSSNQTTDKTHRIAQQHFLAPPLKAQKAKSSKHVESPIGPAASHHGHVISPIAAIYALDPIRPAYKPLASSCTKPYPYHA